MKAKHIKGPWKTDTWTYEDTKTSKLMIVSKDHAIAEAVVSFHHGKDATEITLANAKLIAAAPDLLEACKSALNAGTVSLDTYAESEAKQKEVVATIKAAIAKATD